MHCLKQCLTAGLLTLCLISCSNSNEVKVEDVGSSVEVETPSSRETETEPATQEELVEELMRTRGILRTSSTTWKRSLRTFAGCFATDDSSLRRYPPLHQHVRFKSLRSLALNMMSLICDLILFASRESKEQ